MKKARNDNQHLSVNSFIAVIDDVQIRFLSNILGVIEFVKRDLSCFESNYEGIPAIDVTITMGKFEKPRFYTHFTDSLAYANNSIAIKLGGKLRKFWVEVSTVPYLGASIEVFLPKVYFPESSFGKTRECLIGLITPNFLQRWENSLIDFSQLLYGIVQLRLLQFGYSLLHASSVENTNNIGIAFAGWGQSGKSSIADKLCNGGKWRIISEDFCVISTNRDVIGFQKQRRISTDIGRVMRGTKGSLSKKFLGTVNCLLFKPLRRFGYKSKRVESWKEIYDENSISLRSELHKVIYLQRGQFREFSFRRISSETMAELCSNMMMIEFRNLTGFFDIIAANGIKNSLSNQFEELATHTTEVYRASFTSVECYVFEIPFVRDIDTIVCRLEEELAKPNHILGNI